MKQISAQDAQDNIKTSKRQIHEHVRTSEDNKMNNVRQYCGYVYLYECIATYHYRDEMNNMAGLEPNLATRRISDRSLGSHTPRLRGGETWGSSD